ncbi:MAG: hypothetical protein C0623_01500, partial [Desulfuromonas sp.]
MKIGVKLAIGFGVVITLVVVLGLVGAYQTSKLEHEYGVEFKAHQDTNMYSDELVADVLQVRRREKDFLARLDMKYPDMVYKHIDEAKNVAGMIIDLDVDPEVVSLSRDVQQNLDNYKSGFRSAVEAYVAIGLTEKDGLRGAFRDAAHGVEKVLTDNDMRQAEIEYLNMRRHEKDYMLRGADKYLQKNAESLDKLNKIVAQSTLSARAKGSIYEQLNQYKSSFAELVGKQESVSGIMSTAKVYADKVIEDAESIEEISTRVGEIEEANIIASAKTSQFFMWGLIIVSALLGIGFAYYITRIIVRPLDKAVDTARRMAVGDLGMTIEVNSKDETGILLGAMKEMVDANRDVAQTADRIAGGDLGVKITPRSGEDTLLKALASMVGNLT